jgi:hypothetical protein
MTVESEVADLTVQTTELLDVCVSLRDSTTTLIADAVIVSENAAQIPLVTVAKNLIDTQTLLVTYMTGGQI